MGQNIINLQSSDVSHVFFPKLFHIQWIFLKVNFLKSVQGLLYNRKKT